MKMKDKISNDLSYIKAGYQSDKWKWVLSLPQNATRTTTSVAGSTTSVPLPSNPVVSSTAETQDKQETSTTTDVKSTANEASSVSEGIEQKSDISKSSSPSKRFTEEELTKENLFKVFGLDKIPKSLPCQKKCHSNPWCLAELLNGSQKEKARPTDQPRVAEQPVGLQNTANTCWINSALQALYQLPRFRNAINNVDGFTGEESLSSMVYLLQAMFVEMDTHANKAIACSPGSVFEKLALFATQEIMGKDADHEVLKCVSEFLENTIDTLIADPRLEPELSQLFSVSLMRIARWRCPNCDTDHENQLSPATSYTVAAYVSAEECPLDQCLVDLQSGTQTGVSLICGSDSHGQGGCGAQVKVDRIVTPKIQTLPTVLVIRNNSLMDRDLKRRLHVVYPETLDLTSHTLNHEPATYILSSVIFHHGRWVKHFSAHVKTLGKKWYNFNDEQVTEVTSRPTTGNPPENHRNYFSAANVASKYKHRPGLRVSRGAFIWVYVRANVNEEDPHIVPPPETIVEYVLCKQEENVTVNHQMQAKIKKERKELLAKLCVTDTSEDFCLISEPLLSAWYNCDEIEYTPQLSLLSYSLCEHKLFSPRKVHMLKCLKAENVGLLSSEQCGIHFPESRSKLDLPLTLSIENGCCKECTVKSVNHILFIEKVKNLHKEAKREARRDIMGATQVIGSETLEYWPRLALSAYVKDNGLDTEEDDGEGCSDSSKSKTDDSDKGEGEGSKVSRPQHVNGDHCEEKMETVTSSSCDITSCVPENDNVNGCDNQTKDTSAGKVCDSVVGKDDKDSSKEASETKDVDSNKVKDSKESTKELLLFNEDLVCQHNLQSPNAAMYKISTSVAAEIMELCGNSIHPAIYQDDFNLCPECLAQLEASKQACGSGLQQKKQLANLFKEVKRPHPVRDLKKKIFLVSRNFIIDWKSYIRSCERGELQSSGLNALDNSSLLCPHNSLLFPVYGMEPHDLTEHMVLVWEDEWDILKQLYSPSHTIEATYQDSGILVTVPGVCEAGCVEDRAAQDYEEQFTYDCEAIHVRQVNSVNDIPRRVVRSRNPSGVSPAVNNEILGPRKKPRLASKGIAGVGERGTLSTSHRLVRASKYFSSTDTIREVQNFIAERTGIWPMLQTLWLNGEGQVGVPGVNIKEGEESAPTQLTDDHRAMTLNSLRVRPGDTIYFRAAVEDMELAAGDGIVEFNEMDED
ncbi:ubiquitin carboxyl-terminal hydrolase 48-like isoform X3 [Palaemon carinicauda]